MTETIQDLALLSDPLGSLCSPFREGSQPTCRPPTAFRGRLPSWQSHNPTHKTLNYLSKDQNYSRAPWIQFDMMFRVLTDTHGLGNKT